MVAPASIIPSNWFILWTIRRTGQRNLYHMHDRAASFCLSVCAGCCRPNIRCWTQRTRSRWKDGLWWCERRAPTQHSGDPTKYAKARSLDPDQSAWVPKRTTSAEKCICPADATAARATFSGVGTLFGYACMLVYESVRALRTGLFLLVPAINITIECERRVRFDESTIPSAPINININRARARLS